MIVIGLTGPVHHGKSSLAEYLGSYVRAYAHFESSDLVITVANQLMGQAGQYPSNTDLESINIWLRPLPDILNNSLHTTAAFKDIEITTDDYQTGANNVAKLIGYFRQPQTAEEHITADCKDDFRPLLQWLGAYLYAKVGEGIWYDEIKRLVAAEKAKGTELVIVGGLRYPSDEQRLRDLEANIIELQRPGLTDTEQTDLTEQQRSLIHHDSLVYNDGDLSALKACAQLLIDDIEHNRLKFEYYATRASAAS